MTIKPMGRGVTMEIRRRVREVSGLEIDDESSCSLGFAVVDSRPGLGDGVGTWVTSLESVDYLIQHGGQRHVESKFNVPVLNELF